MRRHRLLAATLLLAALPAGAIDVNDGQLAIHGDGAWSYQRTSNQNALGDATTIGNYDLAAFNFLVAARPTSELTITVDFAFDPRHVGLEWMFAEWRVSDRLRFRAGRVKQPIGNSGELVFAGTTRAFYNLASSVYGPANIVATSYLGFGLTGQAVSDTSWTLAWDAYFGALKLGELETYRGLETPAPAGLDAKVAIDRQQVREILGGRLSLTTPFDLTLRISGYGGQLDKDELTRTTFLVGGLSAEYAAGPLRLDGEVFTSRELHVEYSIGAHLTASWSLDAHWQVAARVEGFQTWVDHIAGITPLQRHREAALALDYWFTPGLALKASVHRVLGNHFAFPAGSTYASLAAAFPAERTTMVLLGTQFAF